MVLVEPTQLVFYLQSAKPVQKTEAQEEEASQDQVYEETSDEPPSEDFEPQGQVDERLLAKFYPANSGFYYNSPTLANGSILIGTSSGSNYEVKSQNAFYKLGLSLEKMWEYPLGFCEVRGAATIDSEGNIYFVVEEGRRPGDHRQSKLYLYSLTEDGNLRWSKMFSPERGYNDINQGMVNPAISVDDIIYVGGEELFAFTSDGKLAWSYGESLNILNAPTIDPEGNIYFTTHSVSPSPSRIVSLSRNGNERWVVNTTGEALSSTAFSADFSHLYGAAGTTLHCIEANTGGVIWAYSPEDIPGPFRATPAIDEEGNAFLGTKANELSVFYAIRADGTGLLWKRLIGADLYSSPLLTNGGTICLGSEATRDGQQRLHALDMVTGDVKWTAGYPDNRADTTWSSAVLSEQGILYIGCMDYMDSQDGAYYSGGVFAFQTDSTGLLPSAGSSRFHGGNASTGRRD